MTPYIIETILATLAVVGTVLVVHEYWRRQQWLLVGFFILFGLAPLWFALAGLRLIAAGDPGWIFNRWVSWLIRVPLVVALYVIAYRLRTQHRQRRRP